MAQVQQVTAPQRKPRVGGIKDVSGPFVVEQRLAAVTDIVWEGSDCGVELSETRAGCYDLVTPAANKEATGVDQFAGIGPSFARYAGVECFIGGDQDGPSFEAQATARLEAAEDRTVEAKLMEWALGGTPIAAVGIAAAIANLEQAADAGYIGQPVLLMSRAMADLAYAADVLTRENGRLISPNGTPVVASGAIEGPEIAITGWPTVYASPIVSARGIAWGTNLDMALAERLYAIGIDCEFRAFADTTAP